jgi:hypothetical protein
MQQIGLDERGAGGRPVDLVGRNLDVPLVTVPPRRFEQDPRAVDIGLDERARIEQRAIDVRLGREVDDDVGVLRGAVDDLGVADIAANERVAGVALQVPDVLRITSVGEFIQIGDAIVGMRM